MKKVKFNGKLSLGKETIVKLNDEQMNSINGGITQVSVRTYTCASNECETRHCTLWNQDTCQGTCTIELPTIS